MRNLKSLLLLLLVLVLGLSSSSASVHNGEVQWQILTKLNYSSQIRLHPRILLMVTVPWSGESRSLMKEVANAVTNMQEQFGTLKLMVLYRNSDRMLADALGASEGITFLYYRDSLPYKYRGRLRLQNILSSMRYLSSLLPEELPFKFLNTPEDIKIFIESTDKALLLSEFCGWAPNLLAKEKNNVTEYAFDFKIGTNGTLAAKMKTNRMGIENGKMTCNANGGLSGIPWVAEFTSVNDSDAGNMRPSDKNPCRFEEFQRFESFLSKFLPVVRGFFLPPERIRFGLVSDRSLLSPLGVEDSSSWLMTLHFARCPSCSKVLWEEDDLNSVLQMPSLVVELEDDEHDLGPTLPVNKPTILLFIDRSSDSLDIRRKSKEALDAFRDLALQLWNLNQVNLKNIAKPKESSVEVYKASKSTSKHPRLELATLSQKITPSSKMSIMIMNEGKHISLEKFSSDLPGNSLNDILAYVLQQGRENTLRSLAKDAGFQLLSDDINIKIAETSSADVGIQSKQVPAELPVDGPFEGRVNADEDQRPHVDVKFDQEDYENTERTNAGSAELPDEKNSVHASMPILIEPDHHTPSKIIASDEDLKVEQETLPEGKEKLHFNGFSGSFFFYDGQYRLLKALTAGSMVPSAVIIDPISQKHYVLREQSDFGYTELFDFVSGFSNGSLLPHQQSESISLRPREAPNPPFVNLDFHEADSIPRVTTGTFYELVFGNCSDSTDTGNAWGKDVLVLFTNSWCGFCQRMELVVREVYRAVKGYSSLIQKGSSNDEFGSASGDVKNDILKLPVIYLIDCTLNDCNLILQSVDQRELYPSLLLFPAKGKEALSYGGDMAISDIIKFLADRGSNSPGLLGEKGILWTGAEQGRSQNLHKESPPTEDKFHEVILKDRTPTKYTYDEVRHRTPTGSFHETAPQVAVGSILSATDKLLNIDPFDKSKILIVKVNQTTGFLGIIINKPLSWDHLQLDESLKMLKEAALYFGGPVIKHGTPFVALARKFINDHYREVIPSLYFLDEWATLDAIKGLELGNLSVSDYLFFLGYSSWGWDQLFDEIADGAWSKTDGSTEELDFPWS